MRAKHAGFTMIELMVVVAVLGILVAVAIPTFQTYIYRARTAEAVTFLGEIRQRQESYRSEHGQYCSVSAAAGSSIDTGAWAPTTGPNPSGTKVGWDPTLNSWTQLGAAPDGPVTFQYRSVAGPPGTDPGVDGYDGRDFWFIAQARADLDDDGRELILEAYSEGSHIYWCDETYTAIHAGYE